MSLTEIADKAYSNYIKQSINKMTMTPEESKSLLDLYKKLQEEYVKLKSSSYNKKELVGYRDCLWDLRLFLVEDFGIDKDYLTKQ